jgi:hypothetical protein
VYFNRFQLWPSAGSEHVDRMAWASTEWGWNVWAEFTLQMVMNFTKNSTSISNIYFIKNMHILQQDHTHVRLVPIDGERHVHRRRNPAINKFSTVCLWLPHDCVTTRHSNGWRYRRTTLARQDLRTQQCAVLRLHLFWQK